MSEALHIAIRDGVAFQGQLNTRHGIFRKVEGHGWQFEARGGSRALVIDDPELVASLERKVS